MDKIKKEIKELKKTAVVKERVTADKTLVTKVLLEDKDSSDKKERVICVDDMDTSKNMLSPCCQMDPDVPPPLDEALEACC